MHARLQCAARLNGSLCATVGAGAASNWQGWNDGVANSLRSGGFPFRGRDRIRTRLPILRCDWLIPLGVPSCGAKRLTG